MPSLHIWHSHITVCSKFPHTLRDVFLHLLPHHFVSTIFTSLYCNIVSKLYFIKHFINYLSKLICFYISFHSNSPILNFITLIHLSHSRICILPVFRSVLRVGRAFSANERSFSEARERVTWCFAAVRHSR